MRFCFKYFASVFFFIFSFLIFNSSFSQTLDATRIADSYYNSIVKILLFDSIAEKKQPNSGLIGRGSGFFVSEDGIIFTNRHVVDYCVYGYMDYTYNDATTYEQFRNVAAYSEATLNASTTYKIHRTGHTAPIIQVYTGKGEEDYKLYYAKVIAMDAGSFDGAILKIVADINKNPVTEKFHPVPVGNSDSTRQGEDLCLYGFPAQFDAGLQLTLKDMSTLTFGKHSGWDYVFNKDYGYIKADAAINTGNSGGPVFNTSNKVIGIATATGNKTNIGLVGGINGMYTIARIDNDLLKKLSSAGLKPPPQKAETGSAVVTGAKRNIISQQKLKRIQADKIQERKFQNGMFYVNLLYSSAPKNDFWIDQSGLPVIANPGIVSTSFYETGLELGYVFPVWHAASHFRMNVDYTFFGATVYDVLFDKIQLADTLDIASGSFPVNTNAYFFMKLGPSFSGLLFKRVAIDAYYKAVPSYGYLSGKELMSYQISTGQANEAASLKLGNTIMFSHALGTNVRYKIFSFGVEYSWGTKENIEAFYYPPGQNSPQNGAVSLHRKTLFIKLGVGFPGKEQ